MPSCDICGTSGRLVRALVEGTEMSVCEGCSKYGKVLQTSVTFVKKTEEVKKVIKKPEMVTIIMDGYGRKVKKAREKLGLTQEELGKKVNERESVLQGIENEKTKPDIDTARKLEKALGITLVEQFEDEGAVVHGKQTKEFTLGDMIKLRKR